MKNPPCPVEHHGEAAVHTRSALQGFTLVEVTVSMVLAITIMTYAVTIFEHSLREGRRASTRAQLARQGTVASTMLLHDLRNAGSGVPPLNDANADSAYAGGANLMFDTIVILAAANAVGFLGDFPRPDAQYNGFGLLSSTPGNDSTLLAWHNENNGLCMPKNTNPTCSTADTSYFFPGESGCTGTWTDRTCPWGMRRLVTNERVQIVAGTGAWAVSAFAGGMEQKNSQWFAKLSVALPGAWLNSDGSPLPTGGDGVAFITTVDRVFWYHDATAKTLNRVQCWGDPEPDHENWPGLATNTMPAVANLATLSNGLTQACTGAEVIARDVTDFSLTYYDETNILATAKTSVQRVDFVITLEDTEAKSMMGQAQTHHSVGTVRLRNL